MDIKKTTGVDITTQGDNGTKRPEEEEGGQHQSTTQLHNTLSTTVHDQQPLHQQTITSEQNNLKLIQMHKARSTKRQHTKSEYDTQHGAGDNKSKHDDPALHHSTFI